MPESSELLSSVFMNKNFSRHGSYKTDLHNIVIWLLKYITETHESGIHKEWKPQTACFFKPSAYRHLWSLIRTVPVLKRLLRLLGFSLGKHNASIILTRCTGSPTPSLLGVPKDRMMFSQYTSCSRDCQNVWSSCRNEISELQELDWKMWHDVIPVRDLFLFKFSQCSWNFIGMSHKQRTAASVSLTPVLIGWQSNIHDYWSYIYLYS